MKITFPALLLILCFPVVVDAQERKILNSVISLVMPGAKGKNGACVAYHPLEKKYYAAFAGNAQYPMSVFDEQGSRLSKDDLVVGFDLRGIWYNSSKQALQANGYKDFGWTDFLLDEEGMPQANKLFVFEMSQPGDQAVGCFDEEHEEVLFLSDNKLFTYDINGSSKSETILHTLQGEDSTGAAAYLPERYNSTSAIFTGIPGGEYGLLDVKNKMVVLFDKFTGKPTREWHLDSATGELPASLGFAYANNIVFIFDKKERTWVGYQ